MNRIQAVVVSLLFTSAVSTILYVITAKTQVWFPDADLYLWGLALAGAATFIASIVQIASFFQTNEEHTQPHDKVVSRIKRPPETIDTSELRKQRIHIARNWGTWGATLGFFSGILFGIFFATSSLSIETSNENPIALFILILLTFITVSTSFVGTASIFISLTMSKIGSLLARVLVGLAIGIGLILAAWLINETTSSTISVHPVSIITITGFLGLFVGCVLTSLSCTFTGLIAAIFLFERSAEPTDY